MNRIFTLLLLALTIASTTVAQPFKGKKKNTTAKAKPAVAKTAQQKEEEERIKSMMEQAVQDLKRDLDSLASASDSLLSDVDKASKLDSHKTTNNTFDTLPPAYQPVGWVNDFVQLYSVAERFELDSLIGAFEKATTIEIAIVTIDNTGINKDAFDEYVQALSTRWGVGKKEKNNGIMMAICPGLKRIRISTGLGVMKQMTDNEAASIIQTIVIPQFKQGNYFGGTKQALLAIMQELR